MRSMIGGGAGRNDRGSERGSSVYTFLGVLIVVVVVVATIVLLTRTEFGGSPDTGLIAAKKALGDHQWDTAISLYGKVIKEKPQLASAYVGRSIAYVNAGNMEKALNEAERAVQKAPKDPLAYGQKALAEKLLGKSDEALQDLDKAIALNTAYAWALAQRADIYSRKNQQEKALADIDKALKASPEFTDAYRIRAWIFGRMGKCSKAAEDFNRVAKKKPNDAMVIQDRAWFLLTCPNEKLQDKVKAFDLAKEAMKLTNGKDSVVLETLAEANFRQGDFAKAVDLQKQAIKLKSQSCPSGPCAEEMKERLKKYEMAARKEVRKNYEILPLNSEYKP